MGLYARYVFGEMPLRRLGLGGIGLASFGCVMSLGSQVYAQEKSVPNLKK